MGKESDIEKEIVSYAKAKGCYTRKFVSLGHAGVPDRLFITPDGVVFFIEIKRPGKTPTPLQFREMNEINKRKCSAHWTDTAEMGKAIIDHHTE